MPRLSFGQYDKPHHVFTYLLDNEQQAAICDSLLKGNISLLENFLKGGHDINTQNSLITIEYGYDATEANKGKKLTVIFEAEASFLFAVLAFSVHNAADPTLNLLKKYNVDLNQYFEFKGSYNGMTPVDGTPLHLFAYFNDTQQFIKKLLEAGINPNIKNSLGETVLDVANKFSPKTIKVIDDYCKTHDLSINPISYNEYLTQVKEVQMAQSAKNNLDDHHGNVSATKSVSDDIKNKLEESQAIQPSIDKVENHNEDTQVIQPVDNNSSWYSAIFDYFM